MEYKRTKLMWASFLTLVASGAGFATRAASGGIFESELGINGVQFGEIMGAGFLGFGVVIFVGGIVVETLGYKRVLMLAFLLHLISAAMLIAAPHLFNGWREIDEPRDKAKDRINDLSAELRKELSDPAQDRESADQIPSGPADAGVQALEAGNFPKVVEVIDGLAAKVKSGEMSKGDKEKLRSQLDGMATELDGHMTATIKVYWLLISSVFIFSVCQGLYEAVINPLIAQIYPENKTHYLNILHAGWPAGIIAGGLFAAGFMGSEPWFATVPWEIALATFSVFVIAYGVLAFPEAMPPAVGQKSEGGFGTLFSCFLSLPFLLLICMHGCIGYMELGVDSWMTKLMSNLLANSVVILVYTSFLMFFLRFFAGPIVHRINPIGLLFGSSVVAVIGLIWLGSDITSVAVIFIAATFYSFGKAFLWPTMLGVAGERYPQSGAVAMGAFGMAGVLGVALVGGPRIGTQQGYHMSKNLEERSEETYERYVSAEETEKFGYKFNGLIPERLNAANEVKLKDGKVEDASAIENAKLLSAADKKLLLEHKDTDIKPVQDAYLYGGRQALTLTAIVPGIMAVGFLCLLIYYMAIGGYKVIHLDEDEKGKKPSDKEPEHEPVAT